MSVEDVEIPGYELLRVIGTGGMSTVYLAVQQSLSRSVALKVMAPFLSNQPEFAERFLTEGRIIAQLSHPGIVTIHDIGQLGDLYYLTQEYLVGGTLKDRYKRGFTVDQTIQLIRQIAEALGYAHEKHFVHRDVKPDNVMFRSEESNSPVLTDFGIAKALGAGTSSLTVTGAFYGSPGYFAPEQVSGKTIDGRTDLYSLGVVFYELLTGSPPFIADNSFAAAYMHLHEPVPPLNRQYAELQPILDKLLAKDRQDRYPSAERLIQDLDSLTNAPAWAGSQTVPATKFSAHLADSKTKIGPSASRTKSRLVIGATLVALAATGTGVYFQFVENIPDPQPVAVSALTPTAPGGVPVTTGAGPTQGTGSSQPDTAAAAATVAQMEVESGVLVEKPAPQGQVLVSEEPTETSVTAGTTAEGPSTGTPRLVSSEAKVSDEPRQLERNGRKERESAASLPQQKALPAQPDNQNASQARKIAALIQKASAQRRALKLTSPVGDNAYESLQRVLRLDPGNRDASVLLDEIVVDYGRMATEKLNQSNLPAARELVSRGLAIKPESSTLAEIRERIEQVRREQDAQRRQVEKSARIKKLLATARDLMDAGSLVAPADENAYATLRNVLDLDPLNARAEDMLHQIVGRLAGAARQSLEQGDPKAARTLIDQGLRIRPGDRELTSLKSNATRAENTGGSEDQVDGAAEEPKKPRKVKVIGTF